MSDTLTFSELDGEAPHQPLSFPELDRDPRILHRASRSGYDPDVGGRAWCRLAGIVDEPTCAGACARAPACEPCDYDAASIAAAWCDLAGTDVEAATRLATDPLTRPRNTTGWNPATKARRRAHLFMAALEHRFHARPCRVAPASRWAVGAPTATEYDDEHQPEMSPTRTASPTSASSDQSTPKSIRFRRAPPESSRMEAFPVICQHCTRPAAAAASAGQTDPRIVSLMTEYGLWCPPKRAR